MKVIAIEGLDKSGKQSISLHVKKFLIGNGYTVASTSFPQYDTPTGELIRKWLTKEWNVDQATFDLITAADRQAQQAYIKELEVSGEYDYLIIDRYLTSQVVYGTASGLDEDWVRGLHKYMRKPDIEINLDISAEESMSRVGKHNDGVNDRYEENLDFLHTVRAKYIAMMNMDAIINASNDIDTVKNDVIVTLENLLGMGNDV